MGLGRSGAVSGGGGEFYWRLARHEAKADSVGDGFEEDVFSRGEIDWSNEESENG